MVPAASAVPDSATQKEAQARRGDAGPRPRAAPQSAYERPMMKKVVNTSAISTPWAVTDR
jgi:hypothetical protein